MKSWWLKGLVLLFAVCNISCNGSIDAEFTAEEKEWLVYDKNDTVRFTSQAQDTLTTVIKYISEAEQVSKRYPIEAEVALLTMSNEELFRILLLKDEQNFNKYVRLGNVNRSLKTVSPKDSIPVNGHIYNHVYKFSQDTTKEDLNIWQLYFNKETGFLKFITAEQDSFDLVRPAPSQQSPPS